MENKTESYIVLKPIAERFSRVASEITDDEIRNIIKSEMRNQISSINFYNTVEDIIVEYLEEDGTVEDIIKMYKTELKNRFSLVRGI